MVPTVVNSSSPSSRKYVCGLTKPERVSRSNRAMSTFLLVEPAKSAPKVEFLFQTFSRVLYHWHDDRCSAAECPRTVVPGLLPDREGSGVEHSGGLPAGSGPFHGVRCGP